MCRFGKNAYLRAMKRNFLYLIYILWAFLGLTAAASCHDKNDDPDPGPRPTPVDTMERTVIVYMAAENSLARFTDADSLEIAQALTSIPASTRVVVVIDDHRSSRICVGTRTTPLHTVTTYPANVNVCDSAAMLSLLDSIFHEYPARHYGLCFWSHGSGWVEHDGKSRVKRRSYGIDNGRRDAWSNDGTEMSITTMAAVLRQLPHMDYILFDVCFMACIEVAYELRDVTDYVLASPAEIPGTGAPYDLMMPFLCQSEADISGALNAYFNYYTTGLGYSTYHGVELSGVRTAALEALAEATRPIVAQLYGSRGEASLDGVQRYCPRDESDYYTEYYDMANLIYHNVSHETYAAWRAVFDQAVPFRLCADEWYSALINIHFLTVPDADHTGLVSMFTPGERFDDERHWNTAFHDYEWYHAAGFDQTGW